MPEKFTIKQITLLIVFLIMGIGIGLIVSGLLDCIVHEPDASAAVNFRSAQQVTFASTIIGFVLLMAGLIFKLSAKDRFFEEMQKIKINCLKRWKNVTSANHQNKPSKIDIKA